MTEEGVMDRIAEQRVWGGVTGKDHKINKMGLRQGHLQHVHLHVSKEVPTRHHHGEILKPFLGSQHAGVPLGSVCTRTHSEWGNKHDELEICVLLQGYDLVGITEARWEHSHDWSAATEGCGFFRKDRMGRRGGKAAL